MLVQPSRQEACQRGEESWHESCQELRCSENATQGKATHEIRRETEAERYERQGGRTSRRGSRHWTSIQWYCTGMQGARRTTGRASSRANLTGRPTQKTPEERRGGLPPPQNLQIQIMDPSFGPGGTDSPARDLPPSKLCRVLVAGSGSLVLCVSRHTSCATSREQPCFRLVAPVPRLLVSGKNRASSALANNVPVVHRDY